MRKVFGGEFRSSRSGKRIGYIEDNLDITAQDVLMVTQIQSKKSTYFGVKSRKYPNDFWIYQEIITAAQPDAIVEIGVHHGGTTLALAHLCDLMGHGRVIGVDKTLKHVHINVIKHKRITLIESTGVDGFDKVREIIPKDSRTIVIEDSSHTYENTLEVMRLYSKLIHMGGYMIVEDGICNHGVRNRRIKRGPYEAIRTFLNENKNFRSDRSKERFFITSSPTGFLRRIN